VPLQNIHASRITASTSSSATATIANSSATATIASTTSRSTTEIASSSTNTPSPTPTDYRALFSVVATISGSERTPPNRHDLKIYESAPGAIMGEGSGDHRHDAAGDEKCPPPLPAPLPLVPGRVVVPFAPGAFVVTNLLSPRECADMVEASEQMGYVPDEPMVGWQFDDGITILKF
jgi:hypothetical protein